MGDGDNTVGMRDYIRDILSERDRAVALLAHNIELTVQHEGQMRLMIAASVIAPIVTGVVGWFLGHVGK